MWRFVLFLIVALCVVAYFKQSHPLAKQREVREGYWEMRLGMKVADRDFDIVSVGDKPLASDCDGHGFKLELPKFCSDKVKCTIKNVQCKDTIDERYVRMLDKKPASLHYIHFEGDTPEGPRRAVVVGWGMTQDESKLLCAQAMPPGDQMAGAKGTCI